MLDWKSVFTICSICFKSYSYFFKPITYVLFEALNEVESEGVRHAVDLIEEGADEVVLNLKLGELGCIVNAATVGRVWLLGKGLNALVEHI